MKVSAQKHRDHLIQIEMENVEFLMSDEGGRLTLEQCAQRLGVGYPGLQKRWMNHRKVAA